MPEATLIAAEDTRVTRRLLQSLSIDAPKIVSLRAKNEKQMAPSLLDEAMNGDLVYVCDAGTPCISDPGSTLIEQAISKGIRILSVPDLLVFRLLWLHQDLRRYLPILLDLHQKKVETIGW